MSAITTSNLKTNIVKDFIKSIDDVNNSLYLFIGRQLPWGNESLPDVPVDSVKAFNDAWNNMLAMKMVTQNNMSPVVPNIPWVANTNYLAYSDDSPNLFTSNMSFFVINSNNEIYKCLSNNSGSLSVNEPLGLGTSSNNYIQQTPDGYIWKYMLDVEDNDQFFNYYWMPIPILAPTNSTQELIENAAVTGSIDVINVTTGGQNYANSSVSYIVNITGDGTGANAYANVSNGMISNIVMVNRGQNYSFAKVTFTDPTGFGANAVPIIPPKGGHGSNAIEELGASTLMISIATNADEGGYFTISNSFRQNGLILNPFNYTSNTVATNNLIQTATTLNMSGGIGTFINGETVYQGTSINTPTFSGTVIDFNPLSGVLRLNNVIGTAPVLQGILYGVTSGAQRYPINVTLPDVMHYTGDILELDNEVAVARSNTQSELFQYAISF